MREHKGEHLKGSVKEAVGDLTGDEELRREGKVDKGEARVKRGVSRAAETVKDVVNPKR